MEFHVSSKLRKICTFDESLFSFNGNVIFTNFPAVRKFASLINKTMDPVLDGQKMIKAGQLNAMGLIDEIFHYVCKEFRKKANPDAFKQVFNHLEQTLGKSEVNKLLTEFNKEFSPVSVFRGDKDIKTYLEESTDGISNKISTLEEMILLHLANENPAFSQFSPLFNDESLLKNSHYLTSWALIQEFFKSQPLFGPYKNDLITMLREPAVFSPLSLKGQLDYIRQHWAGVLEEYILRLLSGMDMISEEEKPGWSGNFSGPPPMESYNYDSLMKEYERFSPDREWMPRVVLIAKTVLVWLYQLSKKYDTAITRLDQIPDEEIDTLAKQGFTGLWLIGLWERSWASKRIKQKCGNPEAAASAYSLHDYDIATELGGWEALDNLRKRCWYRGIRLASDMVPNHTGMDSKWVVERPDLFVQTKECPFPGYTFTGENLSLDPRISVYLEDHYYSKNDCAVVYKRVDNSTGDVRYLYHGNDGTGMPWNDTAQLDFLNSETREAVIQKILQVARNFPIIRFDAAMVLAKKHIRRLWYPEPGQGGDIASRAEHALSRNDFEARIPNEFWREVVDRCAAEVPDTLLLAEAFWMMEGYFVRTLGMHRVYNSAFMNMLKREDNQKYRDTVKNTLMFDPEVLKRFVNFMNNPDEETAVAQFGKDDKYFGVCTLMVTMPGLPMFGHGQLQGFEEKYGMEYVKAYRDETPDYNLIDRHQHDIFPLMKKRYLFSGIENFFFYDCIDNGSVNENIFAYSNMYKEERAIVFYNNVYQRAQGWIKTSCKYAIKNQDNSINQKTLDLFDALKLSDKPNTYTIFREQHSGLWFIRDNSEIREKGLFVCLNGFEYQVLLNINEVTDDSTGKYRLLAESLGGKGVKNIDVALKEVFLKDLYSALIKFATPEFFQTIESLCGIKQKGSPENTTVKTTSKAKSKITTLKALFELSEKAGIEYFETLISFICGNYGSDAVIDITAAGKKLSAEIAYKNFATRITKLVNITRKESTDTPEIIKYIRKSLVTDNGVVASLAAYTMAYSLRDVIGDKATAKDTQSLIRLWSLDRKLREILIDCNCDPQELYVLFKTLVETTSFCDTKVTTKTWKNAAYKAVLSLTENKNAEIILGINQYNNIFWFNKEKATDALWASIMQYLLFAAEKSEYESLNNLKNAIDDACKNSEYKVSELISILKTDELLELEPKPKSSSTKAKSSSIKASKSTVKKEGTQTTTKKKSTKKTVSSTKQESLKQEKNSKKS